MAMMIVVMLYNLIRPLQTLQHPEARDSKNIQLTVCPKEGRFNRILKETLVIIDLEVNSIKYKYAH